MSIRNLGSFSEEKINEENIKNIGEGEKEDLKLGKDANEFELVDKMEIISKNVFNFLAEKKDFMFNFVDEFKKKEKLKKEEAKEKLDKNCELELKSEFNKEENLENKEKEKDEDEDRNKEIEKNVNQQEDAENLEKVDYNENKENQESKINFIFFIYLFM